MRFGKLDAVALIVWGASAVAAIVLYPSLPDRVPVHWNIAGEPDGYASPLGATLMGVLLPIAIYGLMWVLPRIDPRRDNYARFGGAFGIFRGVFLLFLVGLFAVTTANALGHPVPVERVVPAGVGVLFVVLGDLMGQIRHNYFVGIRTPWTLANEEVWRRTHRVGAYAFVAGGAVVALSALVASGMAAFVVMMAAIVGAALVPVVYSYFAWRRVTSPTG